MAHCSHSLRQSNTLGMSTSAHKSCSSAMHRSQQRWRDIRKGSSSSRHNVRCFSAARTAPRTGPHAETQSVDLSHLKDPVKIGSTGRAKAATMDFGGDVCLNTYMTLPIEQYFVLDPSKIRFLTGDRFLLLVPRIHLFSVWLEPRVEVIVKQEMGPQPRIVLEALNCRIQGSDLIQKWRLDERFAIRFTTELRWGPETTATTAASPQLPSSASPPTPSTPSSSPSSSSSAAAAAAAASSQLPARPQSVQTPGQITASAVLEVWSEVIPPFDLMPRDLLIGTCNAVMGGLVNSLLPLFVRSLSSDYKKWANDVQYRLDRAKRSTPLS